MTADLTAWLHSTHLEDDPIGRLGAQLRGDPDNPNPASLGELVAYSGLGQRLR